MVLSLRLLPLLAGRFEVDAVDWRQPQVELVKNSRGEWNLWTLGLPGLKNLSLHDGRVALTSLQEKGNPTVYDRVDLDIRNYVKGQPFSIDAVAHVPNGSDGEFRLKGRGGPLSRVSILSTPFDGTLALNKVPISVLNNILDARALQKADGIASGKTAIKTENGKTSAFGNLKVDNLSFNSAGFGGPVTAQYTLAEDPTTHVMEIPSATVNLGTTSISLNGSVNLGAEPVELNLNVRTSNASAADVGRLASAFGVGLPQDVEITGQMTGDIHLQGPIRTPAMNGAVSARNVRVTGKEVSQPVAIPALDVAITPAELHSNEFELRAGKTTAVAHVAVTQYLSPSPAVDFALRSSTAALSDIRSIARAYGVKGLGRINGSGTLNLNLYARGSLQALRSSEIVKLLSGQMDMDLSGVQLLGTDFSAGAFPKVGQRVDVERVTGHFAFNRGIVSTNDLRIMLNIGNVAAAGLINLQSETLNLRATAVLTKAASKQAMGSGPAGIMAAIVMNPRGELVVPGIITGTFDNPKFQPDKEQLALARLRGIFPTADNPAGLIGTLLGVGHDNSGESGPSLNPAKGIKNVFGRVFGKK
jgi:hypothetical protein